MIATQRFDKGTDWIEEATEEAYNIAIAMLKARKKKGRIKSDGTVDER